MPTRPRSRGPVTATVFLLIALVAAACSPNEPAPSQATTSPPSASPKPVGAIPSATTPPAKPSSQLDVVAAFRAGMASMQTIETTIDGTVTVGAETVPVTGSLLSRGGDSHQTFTISANGKTQTTETIAFGGTTYTRRGEVWFSTPRKTDPSAADMGAAFERAMAGLTDLGPTSINGRTLHRMTPPSGTTIPMASFSAAPGSSDGVMTVEFYAEADGTPAIIAIDATWTQTVGKTATPASMHLDMVLADGGTPPTIEPPSPIWVTKPSKHLAYTLAYPSDWDADLASKPSGTDYYYGLDGEAIAVTRTKKCRCTLNAVASELVRYQRQHIKAFKAIKTTTARVGGLRARRIESRGTYAGSRSWDLTYLVVRGRYMFVFDYSSDAPLTATDREAAEQIMQAVVFR